MFPEWFRGSVPKKITARHGFNCFVLLCLGLTLTLSYILRHPDSLFKYFDAFDYAQIARSIAAGKAYTTNLITPLSWTVTSFLPHPEFWRPPLYPFLVAAGFRVFGTSEIVPVLVSVIAYLLSALLVYGIVNRMTKSSKAALISGAFFVTAPSLFRMGVYAITESTFTMLLLANIFVVIWRKDSPYLLGILGGLLYLTRFNAWFFLAGIAFVAVKKVRGEKLGFGLKYFLSFLIVLSPWMIRNLHHVNSPLYHHQIYQVLSGTAQSSGWGIFFHFDLPNPFHYVLHNPFSLARKWIAGIFDVYNIIHAILSRYWLPFFLSLFSLPVVVRNLGSGQLNVNRTTTKHLWQLTYIAFLSQVLILPLILVNKRLFIPFLCIVAIFAGISISRLIDARKWIGFLLLSAALLFNSYALMTLSFSSPTVPKKEYTQIEELVPPDAYVLSNKYFFLPWYANRTTLAATPNYETSRRNYPVFNYVFLHEQKNVLASGRHRKLHTNYRKNPHFRRDFKSLKTFSSGAELFVRKGLNRTGK